MRVDKKEYYNICEERFQAIKLLEEWFIGTKEKPHLNERTAIFLKLQEKPSADD